MRCIRFLLAVATAGVALGVLVASAGAVVVRLPDGRLAGVMLRPGVDPASVPGSLDRGTAGSARESSRSLLGPDTEPSGDANGNVLYGGGAVLHTSSPYLIFWDPSGGVTTGNKQLLEQYLTDVAADTQESDTFGVGRQYYDSAGYADAGMTFSAASQAILDTQPYPTKESDCPEPAGFTACVDDDQVLTELNRLIAADHLPTDGVADQETHFADAAPVYVVVLPAHTEDCDPPSSCVTDSANDYCSYHAPYVDPHGNWILYAVLPLAVFDYGPKGCQMDNPANTAFQSPNGDEADNLIDTMNHELNETITDPIGNGWYNNSAPPYPPDNPDADGQELADNCEQYGATADPADGLSPDSYEPTLGGSATPVSPDPFGTLYDQLINGHQYYVQSLWSNGQTNCELQPTPALLTPSFSLPARALAGASVSFNPAASTAAAGFSSATWNFGDSGTQFTIGSPTTVTHTFSSAGDYKITLTVVDEHGNLATASRTIPIGAPPTAAFTATPDPAATGSAVSFNAGASTDPNHGGRLTAYAWSFGDGTTASGGTATHTYTHPGTYEATLTVTDSLGFSKTTSQPVVVVSRGTITKIATKRRRLAITVSEPGRVTVGKITRTLAKGGTVTLRIALTKTQRRLAKRHKRVTLTVTINYAPKYGPPIKRRVHWTIRA
jgi:chitodextrinase